MTRNKDKPGIIEIDAKDETKLILDLGVQTKTFASNFYCIVAYQNSLFSIYTNLSPIPKKISTILGFIKSTVNQFISNKT